MVIELFYHIGGFGMLTLSGYILVESFNKGLVPSVLGMIVLALGGWYLGTVSKDLYRVLVLKEKYDVGV